MNWHLYSCVYFIPLYDNIGHSGYNITVLQAVMTVLENYSEQCLEMMCKLLQHMDKATIITSDQMNAVRLKMYVHK